MTDPMTALTLFLLAAAMVLVVIGGGVWMSVRASNADHPALQPEAVLEPVVPAPVVLEPVVTAPAAPAPPAALAS